MGKCCEPALEGYNGSREGLMERIEQAQGLDFEPFY
jgi:hypothetical protein